MILTGRVVTPELAGPGEIRIAGGRITAVTVDPDPAAPAGNLFVPGFVDMHNHGGGGHTFTTADPRQARAAARFHLRHGTTTLLASLVSSPLSLMRAALTGFGPLVADGTLAGIHLEGPYLSPARCGAQDPEQLRDPAIAELAEVVEPGGPVRMVTLAPERDGSIEAIRWLAGRGVVAAVGHTDAAYESVVAAVAAGATVATHLCNGMRPIGHREPGPVVALLESPRVVCELVADGTHLHDAMLRFLARTAGPGRAALVTDATAPAGMPDGRYELGGRTVVVSGGVARLATPDGSPGPLAGSTLTLSAALRRAVGAGVPLVDAVRMAATTPARVLGLAGEVGALAPGHRADLVELDPRLRVLRVMRAGRWL